MSTLQRLGVDKGLNLIGGPLHGTRFDMSSACKQCGSGASQIGPLILHRFRLPKYAVFSTLTGEILIAGELSSELIAAGMTCLGEVHEAKTGERIPVMQLMAEVVLPPFAAQTRNFERHRPCPECDRDGYFEFPNASLELHYSSLARDLLNKDCLATYERFGNSRLRQPFRESVFARPLLLVGDRLAAFLQRAKGVSFEPVFIENVD